MKNKILLGALASVFCASSALADIVKAPVVAKQPIYSNTTVANGTVTQCREVHIQQDKPGVFNGTGEALKGNGDAIAGAIIGGIIGNQFGGGTGKDVMTGLGVIVGSNIGAETNKKPRVITRTICDEIPQYTTQTTITGWNVSYQYDGNVYHTQMKDDPGSYVTLETKTTHSVRK